MFRWICFGNCCWKRENHGWYIHSIIPSPVSPLDYATQLKMYHPLTINPLTSSRRMPWMARIFFSKFSLKIIPHWGPEKIYSRRELVNSNFQKCSFTSEHCCFAWKRKPNTLKWYISQNNCKNHGFTVNMYRSRHKYINALFYSKTKLLTTILWKIAFQRICFPFQKGNYQCSMENTNCRKWRVKTPSIHL